MDIGPLTFGRAYMQGYSTSQNQDIMPKLNALRVIIMAMIAIGYASTMPMGPVNAAGDPIPEWFMHLGYDPSWIGISLLFFFSGLLGMRSLQRHGSSIKYLESRFLRNAPLLAFITLLVVMVVYPIFGTHKGTPLETMKALGTYFLGTVTCIRPGEPLPGLLDDAKYMCLIQGSIWTLKWGVIAHIAVALGQRLNIFGQRIIILGLALTSALFYIVALQIHLLIKPLPGDILLASRLAWPFLVGMAVYAYWDRVPEKITTNIGIAAGFFGIASLMYFVDFIPWTKTIVVSLTMGWAWLGVMCLKMPKNTLSMMNNWPALALAVYLLNWPVSQITLLMLPELTSSALIALSLPITFVLSYVAHKLVSKRSYDFAWQRTVTA